VEYSEYRVGVAGRIGHELGRPQFGFLVEHDRQQMKTVTQCAGDRHGAWHSTGIPDITSFLHFNEFFLSLGALSGPEDLAALPDCPSNDELANCRAFLVGCATNAAGDWVAARLRTPPVYDITFTLAASIAGLVHAGRLAPGYQTPATLLGADFITGFNGCALDWLDVA
jgi:hypothetical protein